MHRPGQRGAERSAGQAQACWLARRRLGAASGSNARAAACPRRTLTRAAVAGPARSRAARAKARQAVRAFIVLRWRGDGGAQAAFNTGGTAAARTAPYLRTASGAVARPTQGITLMPPDALVHERAAVSSCSSGGGAAGRRLRQGRRRRPGPHLLLSRLRLCVAGRLDWRYAAASREGSSHWTELDARSTAPMHHTKIPAVGSTARCWPHAFLPLRRA